MFLWGKKSIIKRIEEHLFLYLRFLFILTNKKSFILRFTFKSSVQDSIFWLFNRPKKMIGIIPMYTIRCCHTVSLQHYSTVLKVTGTQLRVRPLIRFSSPLLRAWQLSIKASSHS